MKKHLFNKIILLLLAVVAVLSVSLAHTVQSNAAAEATIKVSVSAKEVVLGQEFTVTVTCTSNVSMAFLQWNFNYPTSKVKHIPQEGQSESAGIINEMLDFSQGDEAKTVSVKYKFKANAVGTVDFTVTDVENYRLEQVGGSDVIETSVSGASVSIIEKSKSSDANLTSIRGFKEGNSFNVTPAFNKDVTDYKITVPSNYELLYLDYGKSDPDATVTISGDEFIEYGDNKRVITVVAPNGNTKKYTVNVYRQYPATDAPETPTPTPPVVTETPSDFPTETLPPESDIPSETPTAEPTVTPNVDSEGDVIIGNVTTTGINYTVYDIEVYLNGFGDIGDVEIVEFTAGDQKYKGIPVSNSGGNSLYIVCAKPESGDKDLYSYDTYDGSFQRYYGMIPHDEAEATPDIQGGDSFPIATDKADNGDLFSERNIITVLFCIILVLLAVMAVIVVLKRSKDNDEE